MKAKKSKKIIKNPSKPVAAKKTVQKAVSASKAVKAAKPAKKAPVKKPAVEKAVPSKKSAKKPAAAKTEKEVQKPARKAKLTAASKKPAKKAEKKPAKAAKPEILKKLSDKKALKSVMPAKGKEAIKLPPSKKELKAKFFEKTKEIEEIDFPDDMGEEAVSPMKRKVGRPRKSDAEKSKEGVDAKAKKSEAAADDSSSLSKNDTMKVYMQDIGQISLVTKDEEVELAAKIHGNDPKLKEEARATLIKANLRLVVKIAHDFKGLGLPLLDLISEGNIGLMRAVEKFDPAKGAKFSSYAAWWIKQSMRRALANQSKTIRIPVQSAGKINKIKSARLKLTEKLGREPTDAEIASFLEFSERTVAGLRLADLRTFSLHDPIQQGEDGEFQDIIPDRGASIPDRILGDLESVGRLTNLMESLDEREKMILKMRFGLDGNKPRTLEEVSQEIGRTRERVRQIQNQALTKLKSMLIDESGFVYE
ncbi:MAG: sigma-70 family RNA polymerase sigma factor [Victivallales bacterium]